MDLLTDPITPPLTIQDVMRVARVSDDTVRRWIRTGKLKSFRVGRRVLISRTEAEKLLTRPRETTA